MSSYSLQLKTIVEMSSYGEDLTVNQTIEKGRTALFDFDYPLFDPDYKKDFETKIIRNFYFSEIGYETEGRFKFELESWLQLNMPYYNRLYESEILMASIKNPLANYDMVETYLKNRENKITDATEGTQTNNTTGQSESSSTNENEGSNFSRNLEDETPQDRLQITTNNGTGVIEYASKIDENFSSGSSTDESQTSESTTANAVSNSESTGERDEKEKEEYELKRVGNIGVMTYNDLMSGYRDTFLQMEQMIFKHMRKELFMLIY